MERRNTQNRFVHVMAVSVAHASYYEYRSVCEQEAQEQNKNEISVVQLDHRTYILTLH